MSPENGAALQKKVLVIGAGLAGLSSALQLKRRGFDVEVFEARERVGGRVETLREPPFTNGLSAEAGAFWISDTHRLALSYIEEFKLQTDRFELLPGGTNLPYYFHEVGHLLALDEKTGLALSDLHSKNPRVGDWPVRNKHAHETSLWGMFGKYLCSRGEVCDPLAPTWPYEKLSHDIYDLDNISFLDFLKGEGASEGAIDLIRPWFGWWDDLDKLSALFLLRDGGVTRQLCSEPPPKWYTLRHGMDTLALAFLDVLEKMQVRVHLNSPVSRISQDTEAQTVTISYAGEGKDFQKTARYLVCTIPFSVLRDNKVIDVTTAEFSKDKLMAINELEYASVSRVYVQCDKRVWDPLNMFNGVAFVDLPKKLSKKPNVCRMNLLDMTFVQRRRRSDESIWQAYMVGSLSKEVTKKSKAARVKFFLSQMELIPEYKGITKSYRRAGSHGTSRCWDEEKYSRGAYPLFKPGQMLKLMPHIASSQGHVFFAGDHTSGRPGWIEGALQSGHRVAKEIYKQALSEGVSL